MSFMNQVFGPPVPNIQAKELNEKLAASSPPYLVDVREPSEYADGHIEGAKLIPLGQLSNRLNELPKDREIVCVCASGNRSTTASKTLIQAGYQVMNLQGGMFGWRQSRYPVKTGQ